MPTFTAPGGVRLHYEIEGEGPALVLHLGAGCDADLWRAAGYAGPLAQDFSCVLFDHRGHGQSDHPLGAAANHIDRYADDVAALVEHLGLERVSFFGWSNAVPVGLKPDTGHRHRAAYRLVRGPAIVELEPVGGAARHRRAHADDRRRA